MKRNRLLVDQLGIEPHAWFDIKQGFSWAQHYLLFKEREKEVACATRILDCPEFSEFIEGKTMRFGKQANYMDHAGIYAVNLFSLMMAGRYTDAILFINQIFAEAEKLPDTWKRVDILFNLLLILMGDFKRYQENLEYDKESILFKQPYEWCLDIIVNNSRGKLLRWKNFWDSGFQVFPDTIGDLSLITTVVYHDMTAHVLDIADYYLLGDEYFYAAPLVFDSNAGVIASQLHEYALKPSRKTAITCITDKPAVISMQKERVELRIDSPEERAVLDELETQIGFKLPIVDEIECNSFGVVITDGHVTGLGIYKKGLTSIPESIGQLPSLKTLAVANNQIIYLPESIGQLSLLVELNLWVNDLATLPESIGDLKSLQKLELYDNKLAVLPDTIGQLSALQHLNLYKNHLTSLPESISELKSLCVLDLKANQFKTLPDTLGQLTALQSLDVRNNPLRKLPASIEQLTSLKSLKTPFDTLLSSLSEKFLKRLNKF